MSTIILSPGITSARGVFDVPSSKSISNRLLIINALSGDNIKIDNLSEADDTLELKKCLEQSSPIFYAGSGATTARFLLAYLSIQEGEWVLDASAQMRLRNIEPLVEALRQLDADITYLDKQGYLPVKISGHPLKGRAIDVGASVSSQFISALMLVAPYIQNVLEIRFKPGGVSKTYINMTTKLMQQCGAHVTAANGNISIDNTSYTHTQVAVEKDWSSAAFAYALAALSEDPDILIADLMPSSLQGDSIVADMFHYFKVKTIFNDIGTRLIKGNERTPKQHINIKAYPDLGPALLVTCAALGTETELTGITHLKYKESNRIESIKTNLEKMGIDIRLDKDTLYTKGKAIAGNYVIETFNDHRIAMAFAPLVLRGFTLSITQAECVTKSFPLYWEQLEKLGIKTEFTL